MLSTRFICASVPVFVLAACSGTSGNEGTGTTQAALTGLVEVRAVNDNSASIIASLPVAPQVAGLSKIVVSVARVDAKVDVDTVGREHDDDSWVTVASGPFSLDLLSLDGGTLATLGVTQLPAGDVDSLRLILGDGGSSYVVTSTGATLPLVVPSGEQAGIRVTGDFDAQACATGHVTLEFAGRHSIEVHPDGNGDSYVLRPVVRVSEATMTGACASEAKSEQH